MLRGEYTNHNYCIITSKLANQGTAKANYTKKQIIPKCVIDCHQLTQHKRNLPIHHFFFPIERDQNRPQFDRSAVFDLSTGQSGWPLLI